MNRFDLTTIEPLDVKLDFDFNGQYFDLHNDFDCNEVKMCNEDLILYFRNEHCLLRMVFCQFEMEELVSFFSEEAFGTLDNLNLHTSENPGSENAFWFTLSFTETAEYDLSCSSAFLEVVEVDH